LPQAEGKNQVEVIVMVSVTDLIAFFRAFIQDKPALRRTVGTNGSA
jgi:Na+-translocating ferredoxin:NAD+ oxidoreductase RnfC subunit